MAQTEDEQSRTPIGDGSTSKRTTDKRRHRRHRGHTKMAPCPACGHMISRRWSRCPYCGDMSPFGAGSRSGMLIIAIVGIPLIVIVLGYLLATFLGSYW